MGIKTTSKTAQEKGKLPRVYFENLDALRFLAAFSVFGFHYFRDINANFPDLESSQLFQGLLVITNKGNLGVNFFFVLSGFLITYLILHEHKHRGYFSLGKFLIRRTLRIWPLYFIVGVLGFLLFPWLIPGYTTSHDPLNYAFFLANFDEIWNGLNDPIGFLTSPWSVAVEEQFYLFWGICLFLLSKLKLLRPEFLILILYLLSFWFRWEYVDDPRLLYYHTISVSQDILMGALIGIALFRGNRLLDWLKALPQFVVLMTYLFGIILCIVKNKVFVGDLLIFERLPLSLFFGFVILDQIRGDHSFFKFGRVKVFNYLGKISYGIYMYHLVIMYLISEYIESVGWNGYWLIPAYFFSSLIAVVIVSGLSYRFIESKFLKLKPK